MIKRIFLSKAFCLSLFFLCIAPSQARTQTPLETQPDTLLRLTDLLIELGTSNPELLASRLETQELSLQSDRVSTLPDPSIRAMYQPAPVLTARGAQRSQWSIEQAIPYPGKLKLKGSIAYHTAQIKGFETEAFEKDLHLQVKEAYFTIYRIQQQRAHILAFIERLNSFESISTTRYEVGAGIQQDILKTQLERNALSLLLLELSSQRHAASQTLSRLLNRPLPTTFTVTVDSVDQLSLDAIHLFDQASTLRPEVHALEIASERADDQLALALKQSRPDFKIGLTYFDIAKADVPITATGRDAFGIGATVQIPLHRRPRRAQVEQARLQRRQIEARQEALFTSITTDIQDLVYQLSERARQLELLEQSLIPQSEITLQATLGSYSTGATHFLDLLDSERTLFSHRMHYEDTYTQYLLLIATLERALGVDSLSDLIADDLQP